MPAAVWLGDLPVAMLVPGKPAYYIAPDQLGAPHYIASSTAAAVWRWDHDPFGTGAPSGSVTYNLRFPGQYFDSETGLHYNGFRDYDPSTGRYVQSDPLGFLGGINQYEYAAQNPLQLTDDLGLTAACPATLSEIEIAACYPHGAAEGFTSYGGASSYFHCGGTVFLEYRSNRSSAVLDPVAECVYDQAGALIDDNHPYSMCKGTPDQYPIYGSWACPSNWPYDYPHTNYDIGGPNAKTADNRSLGDVAHQETLRYYQDVSRNPDGVKAALELYKAVRSLHNRSSAPLTLE